MSHETVQHDFSDRQLMATSSQPNASEWTEIGEAEVIHTIFGKAKVRIIRKRNKMHSAIFLIALVVIAVLVWQGWIYFQATETSASVSAVSLSHISTKVETAAPASELESITVSVASTAMRSKPRTPSQTEFNNPGANEKKGAQQPGELKETGQLASKPVVHQPFRAIRPQSEPLAADTNTAKGQTDNQLLFQPPPKQTVSPAMTSVRAAQAAASSNAAATTSPVAPVNKEEAAHKPNAEDIQLADPINAKH